MTFFEWVAKDKSLRLTPYQLKMVETVSEKGTGELFRYGHQHSKSMIAKLLMQYNREVKSVVENKVLPIRRG
jgi:hypothetical protein